MAATYDFVIPEEDVNVLVERNKESGWADLDPNRRRFAIDYVSNGFNHHEAAKNAGFAKSAGIKLVREPLLSAFILELQNKYFVSQLITKQFVETQYLNILPMLLGQEDVPIIDKKGRQRKGKKFHASELATVLRDLSKSSGFIDSTVKVTGFEDLAEALKAMTEDESVKE